MLDRAARTGGPDWIAFAIAAAEAAFDLYARAAEED
jgi:hypothetical protein